MRGDGEDVKRALGRLLRSPAFVEAVTAVVTEKGDGLWPVLPVTVFDEERLSNNEYPSAELILYRTSFEGEIVKQATHSIGVRWSVVASDEVSVTRHVERLVRATTDLIWNSTLDTITNCGPMIVTEEDYSPLIPMPDHPFVKSGLVMVQVQTWRS